MLSFPVYFTIFGSNAEKTEFLPVLEVAGNWKTIFRRLYTRLFILQAISNIHVTPEIN